LLFLFLPRLRSKAKFQCHLHHITTQASGVNPRTPSMARSSRRCLSFDHSVETRTLG
jgi:hypothetical protein